MHSSGRAFANLAAQQFGEGTTGTTRIGQHEVRRVDNAMRKTISSAAIGLLCLLGLARIASADDDSSKFRPFNGLFADLFDDDAKPQPPPQQHKLQHNYNPQYTVPNYATATAQPRPSSAANPSAAIPAQPAADPPANLPQVTKTSAMPARGATSLPSRRAVTDDTYSFQWKDGGSPGSPIEAPVADGPPSMDRPLAVGVVNSGTRADARASEAVPPVAVWRRAGCRRFDA